MQFPVIPPDQVRVKRVNGFAELAATPFTDGINALCWPRTLPGDFGEVLRLLGSSASQPDVDGGIMALDEARLRRLPVGPAGRVAVEQMLADLRLLQDLGRDPVLNCIHAYPRDEAPGPVATDVFSFHADSAPVEADTWLCTYQGAPSEGLDNAAARRKVDDPVIRAQLLKEFGGPDGDAFCEFLHEHCYDLHYAPLPGAKPYSFGLGNLWRIACDWPGSPVPPCVHRAPATIPGAARLLLIS